MSSNKNINKLRMKNHFLRSVQLERDFDDSSALAGYVLSDPVRSHFSRISEGLRPKSNLRAWRITGDYGSGKSSFALLIANILHGRIKELPESVKKIGLSSSHKLEKCNYVPVLVTCSRKPLIKSIFEAMVTTFENLYSRGAKSTVLKELVVAAKKTEIDDDYAISLLNAANSKIIKDSKGSGILLVIDELGKFLEYAAINSYKQDIFILQRLAEFAVRSAKKPFFVVCILHQGFSAYSSNLSQQAQREWEKVAGRFEEIFFEQPIKQIITLVESALGVDIKLLSRSQKDSLSSAMREFTKMGWFGLDFKISEAKSADMIYPLHPSVIPITVRIFKKFGQNERSLFSFLLSNEPFGLNYFLENHLDTDFYRLHNLYDYVRSNFGHRLAALSYRSKWSVIDSIIDSFPFESDLQIQILKTVGLLNLLNDSDLVATETVVVKALEGQYSEKEIKDSTNFLKSRKGVLFCRGRSHGFCLWPHTSVDLDFSYEEASKIIGVEKRVSSQIENYLEARPIVARRHYIKTGNLRYFEVKYCPIDELELSLFHNSEGLIIVPLCDTKEDHEKAVEFARNKILKKHPEILVSVPQPLQSLTSLLTEVQKWEWIQNNIHELKADRFAREEVSRQKQASVNIFTQRLSDLIGLHQFRESESLDFYHCSKKIDVSSSKDLLQKLSKLFDEIYNKSPQINNELINRNNLSSAAAAARMRLIEALVASVEKEYLGMPSKKRPPEMSMYLSLLYNSGIHKRKDNIWCLEVPELGEDRIRIKPSLDAVTELLYAAEDRKISVTDLYEHLKKPPYGLKDGILPIVLTIYILLNERNIAFYKNNTFIPKIDEPNMQVLTKAPEKFEIQFCSIEGIRAEVFSRLVNALEIKDVEEKNNTELLAIVRSLCTFIAGLPEYVLKTKSLSACALNVRNEIVNAGDPFKLLFYSLPKACDFAPIKSKTKSNRVVEFIESLQTALGELRSCYPKLQLWMKDQIMDSFKFSGSFHNLRRLLAERSEQVLIGVKETKLKAFCLRLLDDSLPESEWLESMGSFLSLKPPMNWRDEEKVLFSHELAQYVTKFNHVESIVFSGNTQCKSTIGLRVAVTQRNGHEVEQVLHYNSGEERKLKKLQKELENILLKNERLGLVAATRTIMDLLKKGNYEEEN